MDGASKFVRGDAVAAILILLINLVGGLTIGMLQHDLSFDEATRAYILLTIGDGLVATIPALILSLATAIIVARVTTDESAPEQATKQLGNPLAFGLAGGTLTLLGLIPGMPNAVFLSLGLSAIGVAYALSKMGARKIEQDARDEIVQETSKEVLDLDWDDAGQVDVIGIELGYGLIPLIDESHDGKLLQRTKGIRKKLSSDFGFLLPTIRIRDNLDSAPNNYKIVLNGSSRGSGQIEMGKELAINPGQVLEEVDGIKTQDPAFGLEAVWINEGDKEYAQAVGYTVVDPSTVIATHLNSILRANADEFMTFDIAQEMLDRIGEQSPKMLEELIPEQLPLSSFVKILQNLLAEGVPLRDMRTLLETVSEGVANTKDPEALTAMVRIRLGRLIVQEASQEQATLEVLTLDPGLEQLLSDLVRSATSIDEVALEPNLSESFFSAISQSIKQLEETEKEAVLVVSPILRPWLAKLLRRASQDVKVLSYREVPDDQSIKIIQTIELEEKSENGVEE